MNFMLGVATSPEEITLTINTVIALLGGSSAISIALAVWIGRIWANRIAQREQAQLDERLELVRTDQQQKLKLFEEKLAKDRRVDENKHKVLGETMSMLSRLLVLIGNIEMVYLNKGDFQSQRRCWDKYDKFMYSLKAHFDGYEIPYLQAYVADYERVGVLINALTRERQEAENERRQYLINFSELKAGIKAFQIKIAAAEGVK